MWSTAGGGYSPWGAGDDVFFRGLPNDADVIDVVARADGYATQVGRFAGDSLADLRAGKASITLHRGDEVHLKLNVPNGVDLPDDLLPQLYFPQFARRVRMLWQPVNLRNGRVRPDLNMLNLSRIADGLYSFRLRKDRTNFLVAFHHPGWLQFRAAR